MTDKLQIIWLIIEDSCSKVTHAMDKFQVTAFKKAKT